MKNLLTAAIIGAFALAVFAIQSWHDRRRPMLFGKGWLAVIFVSIFGLVMLLTLHFAHAHDEGQWGNQDPAIREWYEHLMQPDVPTASCCGEADAYWCDDYYGRDGKAFCRITDDRADEPRNRPHVEIGTEIEIPPNKLKWDRSNPTGHGVVFLSRAGYVYCFVAPGGV